MAKVLLGTGVEEVDRELTEYIKQNENLGIEIIGELYYREAVGSMLNECEIIVISEELPGSENFIDETIYKLRMRGIRVIILVGDDGIENVELIQRAVSLGIYDFIYNPVTIQKITEKILKTSTLADIPEKYLKPAKEAPEKSSLPRDKTIAMFGKKLKIFGRDAKLEDKKEAILCFPLNEKDNHKLFKTKLPEGFVLFGDYNGVQCSNSISDLSLANPKAIIVLADDRGYIDKIKAIRRECILISVPIVVVGECNNEVCYSAGADECIETLDEKAVLRIQSKSKQMKEIWANALKDDLTGLYKRNFLNEYLSEQERRYKDTGVPFSLLLADLDHFKGVNDTHGHQAGDAVLKKFAAFLQEGVRKVDVVARYGGEEFVVAFPGTGIREALPVAGRLRQLWEKHKIELPSGEKIRSSYSAGIAEMGKDADNWEALIEAADEALYRAKRTGRNKVLVAGAPELRKPGDPESIDLSSHFIILNGYAPREVVDLATRIKGKLAIIDADVVNANIASAFGIDPESVWQSDWRAGPTAEPFKINKNLKLYGLDRDVKDFQKRDSDILADLILGLRKSGQKVLINTGDNEEILGVVKSLKEEEKNNGLCMRV